MDHRFYEIKVMVTLALLPNYSHYLIFCCTVMLRVIVHDRWLRIQVALYVIKAKKSYLVRLYVKQLNVTS